MQPLIRLYDHLAGTLDRAGDEILPLLARLAFAATLLGYYWASALTKLGDGPLGLLRPSTGAYAQIFPRQLEAVGYDATQLSALHWLVVTLGTWAEFLLPALIVAGLFTRLAALGMIGFVILQSLTDIFGHGLTDPATIGAWFDRMPDGTLFDQRLFWVLLLAVPAIKGAGALSLDTLLRRRMAPVRV
ncbi:DoxX family protein [Antarcticimicrobium luteum]|uniref:DoxX family protein n=1 Tax=Antarcticimicrobium luteum TaxID=2547397 RepID=A0A4R5UPS5_9RHOB|nr:DoxX family protein [Antarcticimicrobium luteum]TDK41002.1 DoxX family protein [Antarcticimicrobium luteum]